MEAANEVVESGVPMETRIPESKHDKRNVRASENAKPRKNATPTHTISPHSFSYPSSNFPYLIITLARRISTILVFFGFLPLPEPSVTLASTLRS
jgi:hypothetical protein